MSKIAISNLEKFQIGNLKETIGRGTVFNEEWNTQLSEIISDIQNDPQTILPTPNLSDKIGIAAFRMIEKPIYLKEDSYYYPLDSDLNGIKGDEFVNPFEVGPTNNDRKPNISGTPSSAFKSPIFSGYGVFNSSNPTNLINVNTNDVVIPTSVTKSNCDINIPQDKYGVVISDANTQDTGDAVMYWPIHIEEAGDYCVSAWFRLEGDNRGTKIYGLHFATPSDSLLSMRTNNYESYPISPNVEATEVVSSSRATERQMFTLDTHWVRHSLVSTITTPGDYNVVIVWPGTERTLDRTNQIKIAGLLVEKNSRPSNYEYRDVDIIKNGLKSPVLFDFSSIANMEESSWIIIYDRYIDQNADHLEYFDNIGEITFGLRGNQLLLGNSSTTLDDPSFYLCKWAKTTLIHTPGNLTLRIICRNKEAEVSYEYTESLTSQLDNVNYNLCLGGVDASYPGIYRNLIFDYSADQKLDRYLNKFLAISPCENMLDEVGLETDQIPLSFRASYFEEGIHGLMRT